MASKYSVEDKDMFIQILGKYPVIENKKTDVQNIQKKKVAWANITIEYNGTASEKRTVIQLKRLWDKLKRSRKGELPEERREAMATGGGSSKPPPSPKPQIDDIIPHMEFEVDIDTDSDGINLRKNEATAQTPQDMAGPSSTAEVYRLPETSSIIPTTPSIQRENSQRNHLNRLTQARLNLIKKEEAHMEALHKIQMEEALYKKEASRLIMLQEEAKLKKILDS